MGSSPTERGSALAFHSTSDRSTSGSHSQANERDLSGVTVSPAPTPQSPHSSSRPGNQLSAMSDQVELEPSMSNVHTAGFPSSVATHEALTMRPGNEENLTAMRCSSTVRAACQPVLSWMSSAAGTGSAPMMAHTTCRVSEPSMANPTLMPSVRAAGASWSRHASVVHSRGPNGVSSMNSSSPCAPFSRLVTRPGLLTGGFDVDSSHERMRPAARISSLNLALAALCAGRMGMPQAAANRGICHTQPVSAHTSAPANSPPARMARMVLRRFFAQGTRLWRTDRSSPLSVSVPSRMSDSSAWTHRHVPSRSSHAHHMYCPSTAASAGMAHMYAASMDREPNARPTQTSAPAGLIQSPRIQWSARRHDTQSLRSLPGCGAGFPHGSFPVVSGLLAVSRATR